MEFKYKVAVDMRNPLTAIRYPGVEFSGTLEVLSDDAAGVDLVGMALREATAKHREALTEAGSAASEPDEATAVGAFARERARRIKAEEHAAKLEAAVGVRDAHVWALLRALTEYGQVPWWLRAAHAFDALDRLVNSAEAG
jgi:hypothetical protein